MPSSVTFFMSFNLYLPERSEEVFEVNAIQKTFVGHKFYLEIVSDEFCEAILISPILFLKNSHFNDIRGHKLVPKGGHVCGQASVKNSEPENMNLN